MSKELLIKELEEIKILLQKLGENEKVNTINNTLDIMKKEESVYVVTSKYTYDDSFRVESAWSNEEAVKEHVNIMNNKEKKNDYIFQHEFDYEKLKLEG